MVVVNDWWTALMTSLAGALALFLSAIPRVLGFVIILVVGWLIAGLLGGLVARLLRAIRFNELSQRSGFSGFVHNMGVQTDAAGLLAEITKWFIRLIALVVAFDALGLPAVSDVLRQLLLWLPNLVVALVVLVIAGLAANALGSLVRGATAQAGFANPGLLATVARVGVWAFGIVVAVNQIGVATTLVNTLFMGVVAALALALGLSFGLGGRDLAAHLLGNWYRGGRETAARASEVADVANRPVERPVRRPAGD
jgi:hypothetical protein